MKIIIAESLIIFHFMFLLHLSKNNNLFLTQYPMENMIKKDHHLIMIINKIKTKYHKHLQVIIIKTITSVDKNYNGLQNKNKKEILLMRIAISLNRLMMLDKNNQNINLMIKIIPAYIWKLYKLFIMIFYWRCLCCL